MDTKLKPLMDAMGYIRDVRKAMDETSEMFGPLRETMTLLKSAGIDMADTKVQDMSVHEYLEIAPSQWDSLVNKTFQKKEDILPLQTAEVVNLKVRWEKSKGGRAFSPIYVCVCNVQCAMCDVHVC